ADVSAATELFQNAVDDFNQGFFSNAIDLANQAENKAEAARQSHQQNQMLIWMGGGGAGIIIIGAGVYWYLNRRETADKLG
ncbi:MAG: hypothetical protein ABEI86_04595, partial [Halobacteriaceae archaeon]